ncbi:MAG: tetratricopeptide repeat protein [Holophagae bacterium]|jgi:hypothetical protein
MKLASLTRVLAVSVAIVILAFNVAANDPIFVKWLVVDDPGDETIRAYWQQAEAGNLDAEQLVDLGTMLFYRGWSNDAIDYFRQALKLDPTMSEAWFRIGLVKHRKGDLAGARSAYKKCLKRQSGHGWANFYLGLLEEQTGDGKAAMEHYERAFRHAPELANPQVNPEILSSDLQLGAQVRHFDGQRFERAMPMPYLEPASVRAVMRQFEPTPTPVPTAVPEAGGQTTEPAAAAGSAATRRVAPGVRSPGTSSTTSTGGTERTTAGSARRPSRPRGTGGSGSELPTAETTPYGVPPQMRSGSGTEPGDGGTAPRIGDTSPEASLEPLWPGLYDLIETIV